ncbi:MAG TPA: transcription-repair coupling factor, partial [Acidimicrobiales bacterium]|nr:transcription-repair coupling factor [Acidimicrobiales bacterium]
MSLRALPPLLRHEPAMVDAMAVGSTVLAVPEAATAFVVAGLARLSERRPLLVVTPTVRDAERMAHDLEAFLGPGAVAPFPAWDTLPFERVSPELSTMGQRLRLLWQLGVTGDGWGGGEPPDVVVAPVRALLQRLAPADAAATPVTVARGRRVALDELVASLVARGYRREYQVEHRGEVAVRGGIVDVFPSTSDLPVRVDLWGDEVDRLTEFDPGDQRSVSDLDEVTLFGCREVLPTDVVRDRARRLVGDAPWGRAQWERLA